VLISGDQCSEPCLLLAALRLGVMPVSRYPVSINPPAALRANVKSLESLRIPAESLALPAKSMAIPARSLALSKDRQRLQNLRDSRNDAKTQRKENEGFSDRKI